MSEFNGIIVKVDKISARLDYVFQWLLSSTTVWRYAEQNENLSDARKVLNYSEQSIPGALNITPTQWMYEDHLRIPGFRWIEEKHPKLLIDDNEHFDSIAAIFFLISRVEEYTPKFIDLHGRFPSNASANQPFLMIPLADVWRMEILRALGITSTGVTNKIQFSFDIDSAFAYTHKGIVRTLGAIGRDIINLKLAKLTERILCVAGIKNDPFDTYQKIISDCKAHGIELTWFFLLSDRTKENNNISYRSEGLRKLITQLVENFNVGIHPGYETWKNEELLQREMHRLMEITAAPVLHSRQHYLRFTIPETYRLLCGLGVQHEYSMGYADAPGFRAGTSRSFRWFDLHKNQMTDLMVHPFCAMDVTFSRYQKYTVAESIEILQQLYVQVKATDGEFHMLWHNETLSDRDNWRGWKSFWDGALQLISQKGQ